MIDLQWFLEDVISLIAFFITSLIWVYLAGRLWTCGSLTSIDKHYLLNQEQEEQDGKEEA